MMFIAMNRFRVKKGSEEAFEQVWLSRDTQLTKVPGFVEFHLLKGPEHEDYTLYSSHTVWQSKVTFESWTKSEAFRLAHRARACIIRSSRRRGRAARSRNSQAERLGDHEIDDEIEFGRLVDQGIAGLLVHIFSDSA
jgi:heme-degrading monooxygenase HmoA